MAAVRRTRPADHPNGGNATAMHRWPALTTMTRHGGLLAVAAATLIGISACTTTATATPNPSTAPSAADRLSSASPSPVTVEPGAAGPISAPPLDPVTPSPANPTTGPAVGAGGAGLAGQPAAHLAAAPAAPPTVAVRPASGATAVDPVAPITAVATGGTLISVTLVNPAEKRKVAGTISADGSSWQATEPLGYGKSYALTATAINTAGQTVTAASTFTTLVPRNMTLPYLDYTGGYPLTAGATYGVGIVPVVHFDEPITDRAAAQAALHVTTTPAVAGAWYWADDQNVHFRPENYWPAGTRVTISADVYGVEVGPGLYGQSDVTVSFAIGRRQLTEAFDNAPAVDKVIVYDGAGHAIRTMNTSMGKHGGETVNGTYINFYTPSGAYTVLAHTNPEMMSSDTYGLPADAPGGYAPEPIYYSTRISTDGIFLHELDSTVWAQNHGYDVSHGCLNLDQADAIWFYNHSVIGDPVVIHGASGAPQISLWEGGDWSVPWRTWLAGSAR